MCCRTKKNTAHEQIEGATGEHEDCHFYCIPMQINVPAKRVEQNTPSKERSRKRDHGACRNAEAHNCTSQNEKEGEANLRGTEKRKAWPGVISSSPASYHRTTVAWRRERSRYSPESDTADPPDREMFLSHRACSSMCIACPSNMADDDTLHSNSMYKMRLLDKVTSNSMEQYLDAPFAPTV